MSTEGVKQTKVIRKNCGPVMIIMSGIANLVFEDAKGIKHKLVEIRTGDCFGLSDLL